MSKDETVPVDSDEPACAWFEATVQLMDGELEGGARAEALHHVAACVVCGPLVRGWSETAEYLEEGLADAVERAKPALFQLPGEVLQKVKKTPAPPARSRWLSFRFQAFAGLSMAVAAAFVLLPAHLVRPNVTASSESQGVPLATRMAAPAHPAASNDCDMHDLAFDGADGMVYRTETDGMTVIWVQEHEGA